MCSNKTRRRGGASEMEKKKIILEGFLYSPPPQVLHPHTQSIPLPRTLFPIISPILSGDFQRETVEIKDFSSSDVSATCHVRRKNIPKGSGREMQTL